MGARDEFKHVQHVRPNMGTQARERRTAVQHFLAYGASLWRVATI